MRTTIELPDAIFERAEAAAAQRGMSLGGLVLSALERELAEAPNQQKAISLVKFPVIQSPEGVKVDLTDFDFDDLLA